MSEQKSSKVILLAEDEAAVRKYVRAVLIQKGFSVLEAANAAEALQLARSGAHRVDLLLTDVRMPGMSGIELASALKQELPHLRVLIMSGETSGELQFLAGRADFLQKPFLPHALTAKIERAFRSPSPGIEQA